MHIKATSPQNRLCSFDMLPENSITIREILCNSFLEFADAELRGGQFKRDDIRKTAALLTKAAVFMVGEAGLEPARPQ